MASNNNNLLNQHGSLKSRIKNFCSRKNKKYAHFIKE